MIPRTAAAKPVAVKRPVEKPAAAKSTVAERVRAYMLAHPGAGCREVCDAVRTGRPNSRKVVQAAYDKFMARMKI